MSFDSLEQVKLITVDHFKELLQLSPSTKILNKHDITRDHHL